MPPLTATYEQAARWVLSDAGTDRWNPVYRQLLDAPASPSAADLPDPASRDLVLRQVTAPAVLILAVTAQDSTRRVRAALSPGTAGIETSIDDAPATWESLPLSEVPARLEELLRGAGITPEAPRLTIADPAAALRLDETQLAQVRLALERGAAPETAFAELTEVDPLLHDALTAREPRLSLSLSLHDPEGTVAEQPVHFTRLWVHGGSHWYRLDADGTRVGAIHPVTSGDVLGTVLPVLEHGVRFAAACESAGAGR